MGALYLCLSPFFFSLLLSLTILPPLVAPRLTSVCLLGRPLHLTIPYSPSCSPCFCPDPSCSISFSSTYSTFYSLFAFIPTPSFVFTPSFFTSSSFPCFYFFSFHGSGNDGSQRQNTNTRACAREQQLRHANASQNTYSLPHTHHHTIKRKSWSNSCCVSVCVSAS